MKMLVFASFLLLFFCSSIAYDLFDPYSRRYNIRNASFETLFPTTAKNAIQGLVNAAPVIDNEQCKSAYQFASALTLDQLINFQYELIELCPNVYESIKYLNITTWGPVDEFMQIWYSRFIDALWEKIQAKALTCKCVLYENFITAAASDPALLLFLQNNYDPNLCVINDQTMYKWYQFLQQPQIKNRITKFLKIGDFSIQVIEAISKGYLTEARYNLYFEPTPVYPLITYFNASARTIPSFEAFNLYGAMKYYKNNFPPLTVAGRQDLFSKLFCYCLDQSTTMYRIFNRIPLDPIDGITHFDLIIYLSRKDFLISKRLQYSSVPTPPCVP